MEDLLAQVVSLPLLFALCASSGILAPVPEDVPVLVAGVAAGAGQLPVVPALMVAIFAVLCRDFVFYSAGFFLGEQLLTRPWVVRFVGQKRLSGAQNLVARRGAHAVLMGRFFIGFRTPVFLTAGALGVRPASFLLWDGLGLLVMIPATFGLGYFLGEPIFLWLEWVVAVVGLLVWFSLRPERPDES